MTGCALQGMCDNLLTCVVRAWEVGAKPMVVAPAMNTLMWKNELTDEHLLKICSVYQAAYIEPVSQSSSIKRAQIGRGGLRPGFRLGGFGSQCGVESKYTPIVAKFLQIK
jgi:hypothetical protein